MEIEKITIHFDSEGIWKRLDIRGTIEQGKIRGNFKIYQHSFADKEFADFIEDEVDGLAGKIINYFK